MTNQQKKQANTYFWFVFATYLGIHCLGMFLFGRFEGHITITSGAIGAFIFALWRKHCLAKAVKNDQQ